MAAAERTGGRLCGTVRLRAAAAPFAAGWCHRRTCRRNAEVIDAGAEEPRVVPSSEAGERGFCAACGPPLLMRQAKGRGTCDFSRAMPKTPAAVAPHFRKSRLSWAEAADTLPRYARTRPEPRLP